jgi:hypothetical protein
MYRPIYWDFKDPNYPNAFFPPKLVEDCIKIDHCVMSRITNVCQECEPYYILSEDR